MTEYTFNQLIDVDQVRRLLESHHQLSGMAYGLFDNNENDIVSAGWQEICTLFHRAHPVCSERCLESNAFIKAHLHEVGDGFLEYRCGNGMIDVAMPIVIEGRHLATFFVGHFFYDDDPPDRAFFLAQAREFGFDPDDYLAALERAPVFSREYIRANLMFQHSMVQVLAESGLKSLRLVRETELRVMAENELREHSKLKRLEEERQANLWFLESMERVNRAIQGTNNPKWMMSNVLGVALSIFGCDRAYLMYPCDSEAETWEIPVECTAPGFPGAIALGVVISKDAELSAKIRLLLSSDGPVNMGPGTPYKPSGTTAERFGVRSMMAMAVHPKTGKPWEFGIHQCSYDRIWTPGEERLLKEIGRRLEDAMTSLLTIRDLRESEEKYRRIVDTASEGIWMLGPDMVTTFVNQRMAEMLGYSREDLIGSPLTDFMVEEAMPDHLSKLESRRLGISESYECRLCHRDGRTIWVHVSATPIFDAAHFNGSFAMYTDITERKRYEEALLESERRYRELVENANSIILRIDRMGTINFFNEYAQRFFGYTEQEILGRNIVGSIVPERDSKDSDLAAMMQDIGLHPERYTINENENILRDGSRVWISWTNRPLYGHDGQVREILCVGNDATERKRGEEERKRLQEQLNQAQKMECVGQLAGGVAHDFNNIMTAIVGFAHIMGMKLGYDSPLYTYVDKIQTSAERATGLTRDLLTFSRKQVMQLKLIDLGKAIADAQQLVSRLLREDIGLSVTSPDAPLTVMAGENHLTQILMNLTANARDAMPSGGKISITVSSITMDQDYVDRHGYGNVGRFALITFADTGSGMDEKTRERIFDPFFTTKEVGKGTGLGLATVYGIVKQLGGFINVYSEPGKGTIFRIYLPLIGGAAATEEDIAFDVTPPGGAETVLIAEDDPDAREIVESLLSEAGYRVISAGDGIKALRIFSDFMDAIDLLILDAVMPGKNGIDVFQQAQKICPRVKAIMMSGYTSEVMIVNGLIERGLRFLQKPVNPREFLRTVREVLDR